MVTDVQGRVIYVPKPYAFGNPLDIVSYATFDCAFSSAMSTWSNISIRIDDVNDPPVITATDSSSTNSSSRNSLRFAEGEGSSFTLNLSSAFFDPDLSDETHILVNVLPKKGRLYELVNASTGKLNEMYFPPFLLT